MVGADHLLPACRPCADRRRGHRRPRLHQRSSFAACSIVARPSPLRHAAATTPTASARCRRSPRAAIWLGLPWRRRRRVDLPAMAAPPGLSAADAEGAVRRLRPLLSGDPNTVHTSPGVSVAGRAIGERKACRSPEHHIAAYGQEGQICRARRPRPGRPMAASRSPARRRRAQAGLLNTASPGACAPGRRRLQGGASLENPPPLDPLGVPRARPCGGPGGNAPWPSLPFHRSTIFGAGMRC